MTEPLLVWLGSAAGGRPDSSRLGGKGANLMALAAANLPVPAGFCLTTAAYRLFLGHNGCAPGDPVAALRQAFAGGAFPEALARALGEARALLQAAPGGELAVRSSATIEDLEAASFAGQGESVLGVRGDTELLRAVRQVWASLWTERARRYRPVVEGAVPQMAVLVQRLVPCELSGIAFSLDPLDGSAAVVIEAVAGLGDQLAAGRTEGERYRVARDSLLPDPMDPKEGEQERLLTGRQVREIAALVLQVEGLMGAPQDVEWGLHQGQIHLFQARPITVRPAAFFTERIPGDRYLWTGGFLNERLPRPVSPLGWTLLRELLAPLALSDPLTFLGVRPDAIPPLIKLVRGHPYTNVAIFQMLYAVFPSSWLPADAYRFFPGGDTSLRRELPYPRAIWHPRTFGSLAWTFFRQPGVASPWHNWRRWERFERRLERALEGLEAEKLALGSSSRPGVRPLWELHQAAQALDRELLKIHRWSLTLADLTYTLLRRLLGAWVSRDEAESLAAQLVSGLPSYSLAFNAALYRVAAGQEPLERFLGQFGHRGFDLDIAHPNFADDPEQVTGLLAQLASGGAAPPDLEQKAQERRRFEKSIVTRLRGWQAPLFRGVLRLAQIYMRLRENQRFIWQKSLAFQRQLFLEMGKLWVAQGVLDEPERLFCATLSELEAAATGRAPLPRDLMAARCAELHKLEQEHRRAPELTYPRFLQGNRPLPAKDAAAGGSFQGIPVSPGLGRGPARVVLSPDQFAEIRPGDVLVTRGADPAWTPLFGLLAGLILETGGQLSHGAVLAREYGLPAVAAIPGICSRLTDGQPVVLDGRTGAVRVE